MGSVGRTRAPRKYEFDERVADINVQFRMGKSDSELDAKQGRITLEQHLLDYAGITRDVEALQVSIGVCKRKLEQAAH